MSSEDESKLKEKYGSFGTITSQLENVKLSPDFFKKQSERNAKRMKEAKALRLSMQPSWEHTQRVFGRLKGE